MEQSPASAPLWQKDPALMMSPLLEDCAQVVVMQVPPHDIYDISSPDASTHATEYDLDWASVFSGGSPVKEVRRRITEWPADSVQEFGMATPAPVDEYGDGVDWEAASPSEAEADRFHVGLKPSEVEGEAGLALEQEEHNGLHLQEDETKEPAVVVPSSKCTGAHQEADRQETKEPALVVPSVRCTCTPRQEEQEQQQEAREPAAASLQCPCAQPLYALVRRIFLRPRCLRCLVRDREEAIGGREPHGSVANA